MSRRWPAQKPSLQVFLPLWSIPHYFCIRKALTVELIPAGLLISGTTHYSLTRTIEQLYALIKFEIRIRVLANTIGHALPNHGGRIYASILHDPPHLARTSTLRQILLGPSLQQVSSPMFLDSRPGNKQISRDASVSNIHERKQYVKRAYDLV